VKTLRFLFPLLLFTTLSLAADWPQSSGPSGNFEVSEAAPTKWSVALDENIAWKLTLPETGQNTPVIAGDKLFFSTMKPVEADSELGKDIVAWCCDAQSGEVLWQREIPGKYPLRLSGCFSDSTSPPATCDGERVVFINASGAITCFDLAGEKLWSQPFLTAGRTLPFLHDGKVVFTRQIYPPEPDGNFPHSYADSPKEMWTQLQALDMKSGEIAWTSECGVNMGCAIVPQQLSDGRSVAMAGRGGGHGPPEKPDGVSLVDLSDGSTIWTLPLEGFMATMSYRLFQDEAQIFHGGEHLSLDAMTGEIKRRTSIVEKAQVREREGDQWVSRVQSIPESKKGRMITQSSNLLVGKWNYFRSYTHPWLGRVHVESGAVEYLELPLQMAREAGKEDQFIWYVPPKTKKDPQMKEQAIAPNDMKNSRGFTVVGDKRSHGNGWGHIAAPTPSVAGDQLYVPVMNGTVYVINWGAETLDENAITSINDLGPAGRSYTRASLSFAQGKVYAHTIRELICIGE